MSRKVIQNDGTLVEKRKRRSSALKNININTNIHCHGISFAVQLAASTCAMLQCTVRNSRFQNGELFVVWFKGLVRLPPACVGVLFVVWFNGLVRFPPPGVGATSAKYAVRLRFRCWKTSCASGSSHLSGCHASASLRQICFRSSKELPDDSSSSLSTACMAAAGAGTPPGKGARGWSTLIVGFDALLVSAGVGFEAGFGWSAGFGVAAGFDFAAGFGFAATFGFPVPLPLYDACSAPGPGARGGRLLDHATQSV